MRSLLCLVALLAVQADISEDDEIVIVEDYIETDDLTQERPAPRQPSRARGAKGGAGYRTSDAVFDAASKYLKKAKGTLDKFDRYHDGGIVARTYEGLEENLKEFPPHWSSVQQRFKAEPETYRGLHETGAELNQLYEDCLSMIYQQLANHRTLLQSTLRIVPPTKKYRALEKYMSSRLKTSKSASMKKLDRKLSSKENVAEMLRLQKLLRTGKISGLSWKELGDIVLLGLGPCLAGVVVRIALLYFGQSFAADSLFDAFLATLPPYGAAAYAVYLASPSLLSYLNLIVIGIITIVLSIFGTCISVMSILFFLSTGKSRKAKKGKKKE